MSPIAVDESVVYENVNIADIKAKVVTSQVELVATPEPPVADNFMYDFKYNHALPTSDVLGVEIPADCDAQKEAEGIVARLSQALGEGDAQAFANLFLDYGKSIFLSQRRWTGLTKCAGVWRDKLAFTWDYRTFNFRSAVLKAATDILPHTKASNFKFLTPSPNVARPYPDFSQLQFIISFETEIVLASAVVNAVLTKEGWKIYTMHTVAEKLKQFPEVPPADGHMTGSISWEKQRAKDVDAADPEVLIIGGGQK